jgi:hypothetical protein
MRNVPDKSVKNGEGCEIKATKVSTMRSCMKTENHNESEWDQISDTVLDVKCHRTTTVTMQLTKR